jgi:hypothetical protein
MPLNTAVVRHTFFGRGTEWPSGQNDKIHWT